MSVYTKEAMDELRAARRNNSNVSQRGFARNIFMLTDLNRSGRDFLAPVNTETHNLFRRLGHPSEVAIQHLIRGIDRQFRNEVMSIAPVGASRSPRNRKSGNRSRKTVGRGRRVNA